MYKNFFKDRSLILEIEKGKWKKQKVALVTTPEEEDDVERLISLVEVVMVCSPVLLPNLLAPDRAGELLKSEEIEEVTPPPPSLLPSTPDLCCLQKRMPLILSPLSTVGCDKTFQDFSTLLKLLNDYSHGMISKKIARKGSHCNLAIRGFS